MSGSSFSAPKVATIEVSGRTQRSASSSTDALPQRIETGQGKRRTALAIASPHTSCAARPGTFVRAR